jgi:hypothetical protein
MQQVSLQTRKYVVVYRKHSGAAGTEDKDRPVSNADGMTNFSASSGSKPEPYIVDKGGNNGDI